MLRKWRTSSSSRVIRNRLSSAWSSRISLRGATRAICRHSSAPIEPPAPVTITTWPSRYLPTRSSSTRTGSRPSTSSTRSSRTWRMTLPTPASSSNTVGSVRTGIPRARQAVTTRARTVPGAEGIAMMTSSGSTSSRMRSSSSVLPSTRSPWSRRRPRLRGSSSANPTGRRPRLGLRTISRSTSRPPSPAPTISTSRAPRLGWKPRTGRSSTSLMSSRTPQVNARVSRKNRTITPAGADTAISPPPRVDTLTGCTIAM